MYDGKNSMAVSCFLIRAILFIGVHYRGRQKKLLFGSEGLFFYGVKGYSFME